MIEAHTSLESSCLPSSPFIARVPTMASHTIISPTSVDLRKMTTWGLDTLGKAQFTFDT
jgi:hypothetical protein